MPPKLQTSVAITRDRTVVGTAVYVPQVYWLLRMQALAKHRSVGVHDRAAGVVAAGLDAQHSARVRSGQGRTPGRAAAESMRHSRGRRIRWYGGRNVRALISRLPATPVRTVSHTGRPRVDTRLNNTRVI